MCRMRRMRRKCCKIVGFCFAILLMALTPMPHTHPDLVDRNEMKAGVYQWLLLLLIGQVVGTFAIGWRFARGVESITGQFTASNVRFVDHSERISAEQIERLALAREVRMLRIACTRLNALMESE